MEVRIRFAFSACLSVCLVIASLPSSAKASSGFIYPTFRHSLIVRSGQPISGTVWVKMCAPITTPALTESTWAQWDRRLRVKGEPGFYIIDGRRLGNEHIGTTRFKGDAQQRRSK